MTKIYQHISCEERAVIMINDRQGIKAARILDRDRSSITRELNHQPKEASLQFCLDHGTFHKTVMLDCLKNSQKVLPISMVDTLK